MNESEEAIDPVKSTTFYISLRGEGRTTTLLFKRSVVGTIGSRGEISNRGIVRWRQRAC